MKYGIFAMLIILLSACNGVRAAVYTIPKFFLDEGYITPGEQFLQLRYLPEKVKG